MENIMKETGSCGRFQIVQILCIYLARILFIWGAFMMMYGNYNPGWRCKIKTYPGQISNLNETGLQLTRANLEFKLNNTTPIVLNGISTDGSIVHSTNSNSSFSNTNGSFGESETKGFNSQCDDIESCAGNIEFDPESSTIITEFSLVCDRQWIVTVILIVANAGFITGSSIFGQVCEKFGRKAGLYWSTVVIMVSSGLAIFTSNWQTYACCTFFMCCGAFGVTLSSYVFSVEFLNSKWRGYTASRPIVSISLCLFCILMKLLKNWRHLHLATCVLSFIACCGYHIVEESPRWLFIHLQRKKGEKIIQKIAKRNGKQSIEEHTLEEFINSLEIDDKAQTRSYSFLDLFRSKQYALMTLKFSILLTVNVFIYRAISFGMTSVPGNFYHNAIFSSFLQAGILLSVGPISNSIGRRRAGFFYSFMGTTSCFVIVISLFVAEGYTKDNLIKISVYVAKSMTQTAIASNGLLAAESFPTSLRSIALGFMDAVSSTFSFVFAFVIPKNNDNISFATCYSVMAVCFLLNVFIFYSFVETNNQNLQDSVKREKAEVLTESSLPTTNNEEII